MPPRDPRNRRPAPALFPLLLALLAPCGCIDRTDEDIKPSDLPPMTTGTPEERWDYLARLEQKFERADPSSPPAARDLTLAFTSAVITTTDSILADPNSSVAMRERAATGQFLAYDKRKKIDPKAEDQLLEAAKRIEEANRDTIVATLASQERTRILGQIAQRTKDPVEHRERYRDVIASIIHTAGLKPPPEKITEVLYNTSQSCERDRLFDFARQIEEAQVKMFPDDPFTKWARGAIHRHDLLGKPIEDLEGASLADPSKRISIKDFRGKVVLVVFWISSFEPSGLEVLDAEKLRKTLDRSDLVILGVNIDPDPDAAKAFLKKTKIDWPQIHSPIPNADIESELLLRYGVKFHMYKMVVDREGKLSDYGDLIAQVRPTLDKLLGIDAKPKEGTKEEKAGPKEATPARKADDAKG